MIRNRLLLLCLQLLAALFLSCLEPVAGGSSEQGNARVAEISGKIAIDESNSFESIVSLVPDNYRIDTTKQTIITNADKDGRYSFKDVPIGNYFLYARGKIENKAYLSKLLKYDSTFDRKTINRDTVDTLKKTGALKVQVPATLNIAAIYVNGIGKTINVRPGQTIIVDSLPPGNIEIFTIKPQGEPISTIPYKIESFYNGLIISTDTATISYQNRAPTINSDILSDTVYWGDKYSNKLYIYDPEGGPITYTLSGNPTSLHFDTLLKEFYWTNQEKKDSTYHVIFTATDTAKLSDTLFWTFRFVVDTLTKPAIPQGNTALQVNKSYSYFSNITYSGKIFYRYSWGDGDTSIWNSSLLQSHTWLAKGIYNIRIQAFSVHDTSEWSDPLIVTVSDSVFTFNIIGKDTIKLNDSVTYYFDSLLLCEPTATMTLYKDSIPFITKLPFQKSFIFYADTEKSYLIKAVLYCNSLTDSIVAKKIVVVRNVILSNDTALNR
jgi:uncharacterized surface protein with fasciclin (FAS1) repeats